LYATSQCVKDFRTSFQGPIVQAMIYLENTSFLVFHLSQLIYVLIYINLNLKFFASFTLVLAFQHFILQHCWKVTGKATIDLEQKIRTVEEA